MARVRVHQHVNPLSPYYRQAPAPVDMGRFADTEKPLLLDIGSARGRFLLQMAELEPAWNYLGVEIREALVEEANRLAAEAGLTNLRYEFCNAMIWLERLLVSIPTGTLQKITIQFPDPWFKKKHAKRRMVNKELVDASVEKLSAKGIIFVQTDIGSLADEMFEILRSNGHLSESPNTENPFPVKTEREKAVEEKALPVYRRTFIKEG